MRHGLQLVTVRQESEQRLHLAAIDRAVYPILLRDALIDLGLQTSLPGYVSE